MIRGAGLVDVELGPPVDTFAGAGGEDKARQFGTLGYPIRARKLIQSGVEAGNGNH